MDSILKEIGVTNDNEEDILARVLHEQQTKPTASSKRRFRLEFSTVANSIVENVSIGKRDELDFSLKSGFGQGEEETTMVLDKNGESNNNRESSVGKKRERETKTKDQHHDNKVLNALILNANSIARDLDLNSSMDDSRVVSRILTSHHNNTSATSKKKKMNSNGSGNSRIGSATSDVVRNKRPLEIASSSNVRQTRPQSESVRNSVSVTCPSCSREMIFDASKSDLLLSKHLSNCSFSSRPRRATKTTPSYKEENFSEEDDDMDALVFGEDGEEFQPDEEIKDASEKDEVFDTDEEGILEEEINPKRQLRKGRGSSSVNGANVEECTAAIVVDLDDDWEEDDYVVRMSNVEPERLEKATTSYGATILKRTWEALYPYQQAGCEWLYHLYQDGLGGILADEMGLGKTAQVCAHFNELTLTKGYWHGSSCPAFLVVCPATVLQHWLQEMHRWAPMVRTGILHSISKTGKLVGALKAHQMLQVIRMMRRSKETPSIVVITTYESLRKHKEALTQVEWTAVCLDEGQKIRNPSADITAVSKLLPSYHRIVLSGTPIQNSLRELWSLFDFVYPGRLGTLSVFEQTFAVPIRSGGYANATKLQYEVAVRCAATLQSMVKPYLLRRKKDDLILTTQLPAKTEQVLFCQLSEKQRYVYQLILSSSEIQRVLAYKMPAFRAINTLRKLCNHPALVYQQGAIVWQIEKAREFEEGLKKRYRSKSSSSKLKGPTSKMEEIGVSTETRENREDGEIIGIASNSAKDLSEDGVDNLYNAEDEDVGLQTLLSMEGSGNISWNDSGKMLVLSKILPIWKVEGHKVLIFSQTTTVLDLLQGMMDEMGFTYLRLDGSTDVGRRPELIASFNQNPEIFVMLLTTRTGGVGISLTAANRVILFDPDWNPMTDIQARERAWRLGQKREVVIYRLITKGTIEEKIYHRQIFKLLISNRVLDSSKAKSIISKSQLRELFEFDGEDGENSSRLNVEDLPSDSKVDFSKQSSSCSSSSASKSSVDQNIGITDLSDLDIAPHIESTTGDITKEQGSSNNNSSTGKDHLLLKALFDGAAITDVYDHEYLEPSAKKTAAEKNVTLEKRATDIAQQAVKTLQSSSRVFVPDSVDRNSMGGHVQNVNNPLSSSSLLESIRANQQSVKKSIEDHSSVAQMTSSSSHQPQPAASSTRLRATIGTSSGSQYRKDTPEPRGIAANIRTRLLKLFDTDSLGQTTTGLTTPYILSSFRDLGDQYAPLFKYILRDIAKFENGKWKKKQK